MLGWLAAGTFAHASRWTEEDFVTRTPTRYPYRIAVDADASVVGDLSTYVVQEGDTLLDVGRHFDLGYNEMTSANPGVDPWMPSPGEVLLIPTEFVLPDARPQGVIVNIPEMRLYHYQPGGLVVTYPVGLGRDDWRTPEGTFKIRGKTENPTWVIPESIRAEHIRERNDPRTFIAGGDPENPLGHHRLELTLPLYALHGSNMPWGVGMQVSHGCVRLYNEDIAVLFREVPVGSPGEFLYQPVKVGSRNDDIYVEVHPDIYSLRGDLVEEARRLLTKRGWLDRIDESSLRQAVAAQSGLAVVIGNATVAIPQDRAEAAEQ
jgi:L,D-transpeptidase ErfK/SrfK